MAKKRIDEEPMLEESSEEILLEETSGEETLLEESADSETLLEESSDEVLLEEEHEPLAKECRNKQEKAAKLLGIVEALRKEKEAEANNSNPNEDDKKRAVVDNILSNMVGGFEIIHVFSKNEPFKVCKYLVTQHEWETIMGDNPSWEKAPQFPVTNITYNEAQVFVERVNRYAKVKGVEFLIPKPDMQWLGYQREFAKAFNNSSSKAFSIVVSASGFCWWEGTSSGHLHPVGQLLPSAGIYDACGLIFEFCQMKKSEYLHYGAYDQSIDYITRGTKSFGPIYADKRYDNVGLRLICMGS